MENKTEKLNLQQERFCQLFASDREFFGNGLQAYMEAYGIPQVRWKAAAAAASRLLKSGKVLARINQLLDHLALNDQHVDKQLALVITQNADYKSKVAAIKEYNALRQRIKNKLELDLSQDTKDALDKLSSILK